MERLARRGGSDHAAITAQGLVPLAYELLSGLRNGDTTKHFHGPPRRAAHEEAGKAVLQTLVPTARETGHQPSPRLSPLIIQVPFIVAGVRGIRRGNLCRVVVEIVPVHIQVADLAEHGRDPLELAIEREDRTGGQHVSEGSERGPEAASAHAHLVHALRVQSFPGLRLLDEHLLELLDQAAIGHVYRRVGR